MKLFSEVYGYGSNPLLAGGGGGPAGTAAANSDGGWRPSGGNGKQKSNILHQKALLDEQVKDDNILEIFLLISVYSVGGS